MKTSRTQVTLSEINVTPLVDVMLVLLIVFMVSAPLMQQGLDVNLPKVNTGTLSQSDEPTIVSIQSSKMVKINGKTVASKSMIQQLKAISMTQNNAQVLVQADQAVSYGVVMQVMAEIKSAGIHRVGLVTAPVDEK